MKTTFMKPLFTKWVTEPLFLLLIDFVIGKTMSARVTRKLEDLSLVDSTECMQVYHLLIT